MLICAARSGAREKLPVLPADSGGALTVIYSNPVRNKVLFRRGSRRYDTPAKEATTKRNLLRLSQPAENRNYFGGLPVHKGSIGHHCAHASSYGVCFDDALDGGSAVCRVSNSEGAGKP